jgi:hypothetical protein
MNDRSSQRVCKAFNATRSYIGSPVRRDNVPNSIKNVPPPAVHVIFVSPIGTPQTKLTVP